MNGRNNTIIGGGFNFVEFDVDKVLVDVSGKVKKGKVKKRGVDVFRQHILNARGCCEIRGKFTTFVSPTKNFGFRIWEQLDGYRIIGFLGLNVFLLRNLLFGKSS